MTVAEIVQIAGPTLVVLGGVWRLSGRLSAIETVIDRELNPNGGKSLRDRVVRIEAQLDAYRLNRWDEPEGTPQGF